jgi:hypothetical protein
MKMIFTKKLKFLKAFFLLPAILLFGCSSSNNQSYDKILAKIGDKEISVKEFLRRSELVIRPNNYKDKNTTLNNLISEKILALEAEQNDKILQSPAFQSTLRGIKEQLMRDQLYYEAAFNKVELDTNEIKTVYRASRREYQVEFYTIRDKELAQKIEAMIDSLPQLTEGVFKELEAVVGKKPVQNVDYLEQNDEVIHEAVFSNLLDIGAVVGPLRLSNGEYIIMKVLDWIDYPLISGTDQQIRWNKVKEKLHQAKARKLWRSYQASVMLGKKIEFNEQSFKTLGKIALEYYLQNKQNDSLHYQLSEIPSVEPGIDIHALFFTIDNTVWSVGDFKKELMSHPLVFRTKYVNKSNFPEQFKLAIVDMTRDHYLTQEAYKRDLDNSVEIRKSENMWTDAYLASSQMKNIIDSALEEGIISKDDNPGMLKYWESYLFDLQKKYSTSIRVNQEEFEKISLTDIDYFAIRPGVPYPVPLPNFPTLIASENLDYTKQQKYF